MILSKCSYTRRHKRHIASVVPLIGTTEVYGYLCCLVSTVVMCVYQWCNNGCFMMLFEI
nr:MAG TPA: hypothetical protein [Caudoviricetes sp.]